MTRIAHGLPVRAAAKDTALWLVTALGVIGLVLICNQSRGVPLTLLAASTTAPVARSEALPLLSAMAPANVLVRLVSVIVLGVVNVDGPE